MEQNNGLMVDLITREGMHSFCCMSKEIADRIFQIQNENPEMNMMEVYEQACHGELSNVSNDTLEN